MIRRPKNFKIEKTGFDFKDFSEKLKILHLISEHTIKTVPLVVFADGKLLIARGRNIHVEARFNHGLDDIAISIDKIKGIFDHISGNTRLKIEDDTLIIKSGKFRSRLPKIAQEQEYFITAQSRSNDWYDLPDDFFQALELCSISVSKATNLNWILNNYAIDQNQMITTDQNRCTVFEFKDYDFAGKFSLTKDLVKLLLELKPNKFSTSDNFLEFKNDNYYIKTSMIQEEFPELSAGLFQGQDKIIVNGIDLLNAIEKVKLFSGDDVDKSGSVKLEVKKSKMIISADNSFGEAKEILKVNSDCEFIRFINPDFLIDILKALKKKEIEIIYSEDRFIFREFDYIHVIALLV